MIKEFVGYLLRTSPLWSVPINILIALIAANEADKGRPPVVSTIVVGGFVGILILLLTYYLLA